MLADIRKNLKPTSLVKGALMSTLPEFIEAWGECVLLVQTNDPNGPLAASAQGSSSTARPGTGPRPFQMTVVDQGPARRAPTEPWPESLFAHQLRSRLVRAAHVACAIRKGATSGFAKDERCLIGRSSECDLVLDSAGVSKVHAWIRRAADGHFDFADNGSRNGTLVNGKNLTAQRQVALASGDIITIGGVDVMMCPSEAVWTVLHQP